MADGGARGGTGGPPHPQLQSNRQRYQPAPSHPPAAAERDGAIEAPEEGGGREPWRRAPSPQSQPPFWVLGFQVFQMKAPRVAPSGLSQPMIEPALNQKQLWPFCPPGLPVLWFQAGQSLSS